MRHQIKIPEGESPHPQRDAALSRLTPAGNIYFR